MGVRDAWAWVVDAFTWGFAVVAAVLPRRIWSRFHADVPITPAAAGLSGVLTMFVGFFLGLSGFYEYVGRAADARNTFILTAPIDKAEQMAYAGPALTILTLVEYAFFTPRGLFSTYLALSGLLRGVTAWFDDPQGDPILSALDAGTSRAAARAGRWRRTLAREWREGEDVPDVLITGEAAGLPAADYVVLASRRKAEWTAGAIIMTGEDWYRLGDPVEMELPYGLRTLYPLTKLQAVEVVRRGIEYELPQLSKRRLH